MLEWPQFLYNMSRVLHVVFSTTLHREKNVHGMQPRGCAADSGLNGRASLILAAAQAFELPVPRPLGASRWACAVQAPCLRQHS